MFTSPESTSPSRVRVFGGRVRVKSESLGVRVRVESESLGYESESSLRVFFLRCSFKRLELNAELDLLHAQHTLTIDIFDLCI